MERKGESMRKITKQLLAGFLSATLAVTALPVTSLAMPQKEAKAASVTLQNPRIVKDYSMEAGQKVTWDCIWFGSYPQREVVADTAGYDAIYEDYYNPQTDIIEDAALFQKLETASGWSDNELLLDGNKYRRMKREDAIYSSAGIGCYRWKDNTSWHYFRYEPIKWRVLSTAGNQAFLQTDLALDDQRYNKNFTNVTWETSSMRSWLNGYGPEKNEPKMDYRSDSFLQDAFSSAQQQAIRTTEVENADNLPYGTEGGNHTTDKIFLLSEQEVYGTKADSYGFAESSNTHDEARRRKSSTYAKAKGVWSDYGDGAGYDGNCDWWLRTPGANTDRTMWVIRYGYVERNGFDVDVNGDGVCPALNLNLSSSDLWSYAGTVCSDGTVNEQAKPGSDFQDIVIKKKDTAEQILSKMNLSGLVENVSMGNTKVKGPEVTIAGKTFPLFEFDSALELKLMDRVQAKVDMKSKKVQVLLGFYEFDGSAKLDKDKNSDNYWKESYKEVKELYKNVAGQNASTDKLYHGFQKLRKKLRKNNASIGVKVTSELAGYMEFDFSTGKLRYSSGGVILKTGAECEQVQHLAACPATYVVFRLKGNLNGKFSLERVKDMKFAPKMEAGFQLAATFGAGLGAKKLCTYTEVGMTGNIDFQVSYPAKVLEDAMNLTLTAEVYMESKIFGFDGPSYGPKEFAKEQIYPRTQKATRNLTDSFENFDTSQAKLSARDYLKKQKNGHLSKKLQNVSEFSKINLYPYNNEQLVYLDDGTLLLFWIDDDGSKAGINKTSLMYTICEKDSHIWAEPAKIAETGGANNYPSVYCDGQRAVVVWQKVQTMTDQNTLTDLLKSTELYMTVYENGKFSNAEAVTVTNETYEMMQKVASDGKRTAVVWVENSENDPLQVQGSNTVKLAVKENGKWTSSVIAENLETVQNVEVFCENGETTVLYETKEGEQSVIQCQNGLAHRTFAGQGAQILNGILYYSGKDSLRMYDLHTDQEETLDLPAMNDFLVVENGKSKAVYTTVYDGYTCELAMYAWDASSQKWGDQITLTDYGKYIRDYSVVKDNEGNTVLGLNLVTVDGASSVVYGDSTLCVTKQKPYTDLVIGDGSSYETDLLQPRATIPISFDVKNNSDHTVEQFTAKILDEEGKELSSQKIACHMISGDSTTVQVLYQVPEDLSFHKITLSVMAEGEEKLSDNMLDVFMGYADLSVNSVVLSGNQETAALSGTVKNAGYGAAENVKVNFYFEEEDTPFAGKNLGTIGQQNENNFTVEIPSQYLQVEEEAFGNRIYVEVVSDAQEQSYENNHTDYLIGSQEERTLLLNTDTLDLKPGEEADLQVIYKNLELEGKELFWSSSNPQVARVSEGKVTAVAVGTTVITVTAEGATAECVVTVSKEKTISVQTILLNTVSVKMEKGEKQKLEAQIFPQNASNKDLTWSSLDPSIVAVSKEGELTAKMAGETTISVTAQDGYHSAQCRVVVVQKEDSLKTYNIQAEATEHGSISPKGNVTIEEGKNQKFSVLPEEGYEIAHVLVDGENIGAVPLYIFENVKEDHTIRAEFKKKDVKESESQTENTKQTESESQAENIKQTESQGQAENTENRDKLPEEGDKIQTKNAIYRVTAAGAKGNTAALVKPLKKTNRTFVVPATIKSEDGKFTFKVTAISKNAFKKNTKLKKVTIGKNVSKIGANAFSGCKKLKNIKITSTQLTKKSVGKNVFKGIDKNAVIKVPKKKLKAYKNILKGKGQAKSVKIKK